MVELHNNIRYDAINFTSLMIAIDVTENKSAGDIQWAWQREQ